MTSISLSLLPLTLAFILSSPFYTPTAANPQDPCVITSDSCQCSSTDPSGICMKNQNDGTCLLGLCNEGYRCDCFGFELCHIQSCSKYTSSADTIPSESVPFACHLKLNAASCTTVSDILDTITSSKFAEAEASASDDDAATAADDSTKHVHLILSEKKLIRDAQDELEPLSDDISDDDLDAIDAYAAKVDEELETTADLQLQAVKQSNIASKQKRMARRARRTARKLQKQADKEKAQLEKAQEKHNKRNKKKNKRSSCPLCDKLQKRIKELESGRRTFSKKTGESAREGRRARRSSEKKSREAKDGANRAKTATSACVKKARAAIKELRSSGRARPTKA